MPNNPTNREKTSLPCSLLERRHFMVMMGVLPAAGYIAATSKDAWALSNQVDITQKGQYRYIIANGIPDHNTGRFPNRDNPNSIQSQKHLFRTPFSPRMNARAREVGFDSFGVAVNGVPFDPAANEFWRRDRNSGWQYDAMSGKVNLGLDKNNAHVQPNGAYHYHGLPTGLIENWSDKQHSPIIGYAADGFPIYVLYAHKDPKNTGSPIQALTSSYKLKSGHRRGGPGGPHDGSFVQDFEFIADLGDLDDCNGRYGITPEYPEGTYAYFLTSEYPFIPRLFRGTPDSSFQKKRSPGGPGGPGGDRPRLGPGGRPPRPRFKL